MQPLIRPTNKANHGPNNHGTKLVNSNGQCPDYSSAKAIDIDDKRVRDLESHVLEEGPDLAFGPPGVIKLHV